jgi:hypothetical protein
MLNKLIEIEKNILDYLSDENSWNSVYVDYHHPYVTRLWRQIGQERIYLHKILPCETNQSLLHTHPWPSAMKVIKGRYEMGVGYSENASTSTPVIASTLILPKHSYYEMADINSWHYVRPLDDSPSYSLMITGKPWGRESPKSDYVLGELRNYEKTDIFSVFFDEYKNNKLLNRN